MNNHVLIDITFHSGDNRYLRLELEDLHTWELGISWTKIKYFDVYNDGDGKWLERCLINRR